MLRGYLAKYYRKRTKRGFRLANATFWSNSIIINNTVYVRWWLKIPPSLFFSHILDKFATASQSSPILYIFDQQYA